MTDSKKEDSKRFELERTNAATNLAFDGWLLAEVGTYDGFKESQEGGLRWREFAVYETKGGKFVLHKAGRSSKPGETDRCSASVLEAAPTAAIIATFFGTSALTGELLDELDLREVEFID